MLGYTTVLDAIDRLVKPGGLVVVEGPNYDSPFWVFLAGLRRIRRKKGGRHACYESVPDMLYGFWVGISSLLRGYAANNPQIQWRYFWPHMEEGQFVFDQADDDAVCWVSAIHLAKWFKTRGYRVLLRNESSHGIGRIVYSLLPYCVPNYRFIFKKSEV